MNIETAKQELLSQTAKIHWDELERYFAAGKVIFVGNELDLIDVGVALIQDNTQDFNNWVKRKMIHPVNDKQAQTWSQHNSVLWASVVTPWVLVQTTQDAAPQTH